MNNPVVMAVIGALIIVILLTAVARGLRGRREAREAATRRDKLRQQQGYLYMQRQEIERLAGRILATSSTGDIAGFRIVRQIEAITTDNHVSPPQAVEALKALAAEKGGNAIINLESSRLPTGKCTASGDAVIIRDEAAPAAPTDRP